MDDFYVGALLTFLSIITFAITQPGRYKPWVYWLQGGACIIIIVLIGKLLGIAPD